MAFRKLKSFPTMQARYEQFKKWEDLKPGERQTAFASVTDEARRAKPLRDTGFMSLFNTVGAERIFLGGKIISPEFTTGAGADVAAVVRNLLKGYTYTVGEIGALVNPIVVGQVRGVKFAKLALTAVVPGVTPKESRITGAKYKKPDVDTVSSPFGQKVGNEDFDKAVSDIKGDEIFTNFLKGNNGKNRAKFTPEGI